MFFKKYANLYRFKPYFMRQRRLLAVLLCCMLTGSSLGVVLSYLSTRQLISITNVDLHGMALFAALIIGTVLTHHIAWFLWDKISAIVASRVASEIRRDLFAATLNTRYSAIRSHATGYYLERLNDDTNEVCYFVQNVVGTLVDVFTNVSFLVIIAIQNWQCALVFTLGIIALYLIGLIKIRVELKHTEKLKQLTEAMDSRMSETIRGVRDIKGLGIQSEVIRRNEEISRQLARQHAKMKNDVIFWERVRTFGQWTIDALIVWMCAFWLLPAGHITSTVILILFNYKGLMYDTISYLSLLKGYYVQGDFKAGRILEILDNPEHETCGSETMTAAAPALEVRNLSFSYGGQEILRNVSLRLEPCSATVLLGASGSGKSTLFALLSRLYPVENGRIFINGFDVNILEAQSLTDHVSIVNQDHFLFSDTILNNLRIVRPSATEAEIHAACRKARIHDEILAMEQGYNTLLTENGGNLSGGQRQRIAIARAILKDTPVILFDEPTSALDKDNQTMFLAALEELKQTKTIFVIAHKLGDLSLFDQVLELQDNRIISR